MEATISVAYRQHRIEEGERQEEAKGKQVRRIRPLT